MTARSLLLSLAALLMAAHFLRGGNLALMLASLLAPLLLLVRRRWSLIVRQGLAYAGAAVWGHTALMLIEQRRVTGAPWGRMALILGGVALLTGLAGLLLNTGRMKERYAAESASADRDLEREEPQAIQKTNQEN